MTTYLAPIAEGTIFGGPKGVAVKDITDGTSSTILVVEANADHAVIWSKPEDGLIIGYKDVRPDEFWVSGHIPGRPLLPGVLMIEAGAQLASFYTRTYVGWKGFIGFGGVDEVKFRMQVPPGVRMASNLSPLD